MSEEPELIIRENSIAHDEMAKYLMSRGTFKTFDDTGEILFYSPKRGKYEFNGAVVIKRAAEKILAKHSLSKQATRSYMAEVVGHVERSTYIPRSKFNSSKRLINLKNGILDLHTMKLRKHTPEFLSTFRIPVEFDPSAECPKVSKFLSQIVSEENVPLLEEEYSVGVLMSEAQFREPLCFSAMGAMGRAHS